MDCSDNDRRLRVQYPGALYHMMSRGVQRSDIYCDDDDRGAFFDRCQAVVKKYAWRFYAATQMTNHFHLLFQTPEANLCRGAQSLLGPFAQRFNARHGRSGHVFEGRYQCRVIENSDYLWTVSRYIHLNPTPLIVAHPADWLWSSYAGYVDDSQRLPWICYDELLGAWEGEFGESREAYCQYVEQGLVDSLAAEPPELRDGWIIGGESFARRIRQLVSPDSNEPNVKRTRRRSASVPLADVVAAVCREFDIPPAALAKKSSRHPARSIVALLAHELSSATMQDVSSLLGLAGRDSIHKIIRRLQTNPRVELQPRIAAIKQRLA